MAERKRIIRAVAHSGKQEESGWRHFFKVAAYDAENYAPTRRATQQATYVACHMTHEATSDGPLKKKIDLLDYIYGYDKK